MRAQGASEGQKFAAKLTSPKTDSSSCFGIHEMGKNRMLTSAIERELEILGEAANHLSAKTKERTPNIPWKQIIGMRHHISHEYFDVDYRIIWKTIKHELPTLHKQLKDLLESFESPSV